MRAHYVFPIFSHLATKVGPTSCTCPQPTYHDLVITQLLNIASSMQHKIYAISQGQPAPITYHVRSSPLSIEILCTLMPRGIKMSHFEKYGGKGDPINHVNAFTTLCSYFVLDERLLAKNFPRTLKDSALEWFSNSPNHLICSFNELVDAFN